MKGFLHLKRFAVLNPDTTGCLSFLSLRFWQQNPVRVRMGVTIGKVKSFSVFKH